MFPNNAPMLVNNAPLLVSKAPPVATNPFDFRPNAPYVFCMDTKDPQPDRRLNVCALLSNRLKSFWC